MKWPAAMALSLLVAPADAVQIASAHVGGVTIALYNEPCAVAAVTNLDYRATWSAGGETWEGCYSINGFGIGVMFFSDLTAVSGPAEIFRRVRHT